jgi:hypothetical protein
VSAIWNDPDFRVLESREQWAYLMLSTQGDISSAGLLALTLRRWAKYAADMTSDALWDAISGLAERRFLVVDEDTEELLVRSFVKWDNGFNNEKRRPAITAAANVVVSPQIRGILADELDSLSVPHSLRDSPSDRAWDSPRVVVTLGDHKPIPQPSTLEREPSAFHAPPSNGYCSKHPTGTEEPCGPCRTARRMVEVAEDARRHNEAQERADRIARAKDCQFCGGSNWIETADGKPGRKCNHLGIA